MVEEHDAAWAHQHHPEWVGDYDAKHQWRDVYAGEATAEVATAHPTRAEAAASGGIETTQHDGCGSSFLVPLQKQCIDCLPQGGSVIYGSSRESRFKAGAAPQLWGAER